MQRQLLQIADKIPDDIVLTLLKSFAKILSREPEPAPRTPFIRAFAKIRDDDKRFSAFLSDDEDSVAKEYDSGNEVETFNFKVTTTTEETAYSVGSNVLNGDQQMATIEESNEAEALNDQQGNELPEIPPMIENNLETIDEGIEVEMPNLLPTDEVSADEAFDKIVESQTEDVIGDSTEMPTVVENDSEKAQDGGTKEEPVEPLPEEIVAVEEEAEPEEPIPTEIEKVSLDDIQREIHEMQAFLQKKGVSPEKKKNKKDETIAEPDSKSIEDAYNVDVCIKLKNKNHSHKKHHHSKYLKSENYKEEIIKDGPIFDPSVPNTEEDFMKVKSVSEKIHKKKQKVQPLDVSWQNLVENQKRNYK